MTFPFPMFIPGAQAEPVAGYTAWYRGDQYVSGTWTDLSANNLDLTEATNPPTAVAADANFNGKPVVDFDGTNDVLGTATTLASFISNTAFTIFAVVRGETRAALDGSAASQRGIFASLTGGNSIGLGFGLTKLEGWNYDGAADYIGPAVNLNTVYGVDFRHDTGEIKILVSGFSEETPVTSGNSSALTDTFRIGSSYRAAAGEFLDGQIAEIIIYNTVLSAADRQTTRDYLAGRYGFTW